MLFYFNMFVLILFIIYVIIKGLKSKSIITIQLVLSIGTFLYLFLGPVMKQSPYILDNNYNFVISCGLIGLILACSIIPYNVSDGKIINKNGEVYKFEVNPTWLNIATFLFVAYLLYNMLSVVIQYGSISAVFTRNRLSAHLGEEYFSSRTLLFITEFLKLLFYINVNRLFSSKKYFSSIILFLLPMMHHWFTATTRFDFVAMMIIGLIFIYDERLWTSARKTSKNKVKSSNIDTHDGLLRSKKKINIILLSVYGLVIVYATSIFMYISNFTRAGMVSTSSEFSITAIIKKVISTDISYYDFFYEIYKSVNDKLIELEWGMSWFVYPFLTYIPRSLWLEKPITAFSPRFTDLLYWPLGEGLPVVTFTMYGEGYAQFGIVGALIAPIIFVFSRYINIHYLRRIKHSKMIILLIILSMFTYLRAEAPVFLSILYMIYIFIIIKFLSVKRKID